MDNQRVAVGDSRGFPTPDLKKISQFEGGTRMSRLSW